MTFDRTDRDERGWGTVPRTLGLIGTLIKHLGDRLDASRVFLDLWFRNFDDGLIEVQDEVAFAAACGYARNQRGVRTWRQGMALLEELGFIRVKPKGLKKYGYVLLVHPNDAVERLKEAGDPPIPDWWWGLFTELLADTGSALRLERQRREAEVAAQAEAAAGAEDGEEEDLPF